MSSSFPFPSRIVIIITLFLLGIGGYLFWNDSPINIAHTPVRLSRSGSHEGTETDTGKRLITLGQSGTNWGMNPFGSGKPLEQVTEESPKFQKPNTEWKTRTISGITYVFGEGNPKEVALTSKQIQDISSMACYDPTSPLGIQLYGAYLCDQNTGLRSVSEAVEQHIFAALIDPGWVYLATECGDHLRGTETHDTYENAKNNSGVIFYDRLFSPGFLDIDTFISVEPTTGWKKLNIEKTIGIVQYIMCAMSSGCRGEIENTYKNMCVDKYGANIVRHLEYATDLYNAPLYTSD